MGYMYGEARTFLNVGNLYYLQGKAYRALQQYDAALAVFETLQNRRGMALTRLNRASLRIEIFGATEADFADVKMALAYGHEVDDSITVAQAKALLGACYAGQGDYETAAKWLADGAQALADVAQLWMAAQDYRELGRMHLALGHSAEAEYSLDQAEALLAEIGTQEPDPIILALHGQAARQRGELDRALTLSQEAIEAHKPGQEQEVFIYFWHAQTLEAAGRKAEAAAAISQAYASLQHLLQDFPPELRQRSLRQKPEYRQIAAAFSRQIKTIRQKLPAAAAPLGRPLTADEWRTVQWTIQHPDDERIQNKAQRRRHRLQRLLEEAARQEAMPRVQDLAAALVVSPKTIKRDLAALRAAGHEVRTRGSRERSDS
jgi:tetratricopeptide (TPR) repeat protein